MEVTLALAEEMLLAAGVAADHAAARRILEQAIASGGALDRLRALVEAQGGNPAIVDDPGALPQAPLSAVYEAPRAGVVARVEPRRIGHAIVELGGGRRTTADTVDPAVGFVVTAKPGERVERGQPLATVHARDERTLALGLSALAEAIVVGESAAPLPLVVRRPGR
jgi:thymidine phosphorylase